MPERLPTIPTAILAGTIIPSGSPNTGQVTYSFGGSKTFSSLSGVAPDLRIQAGGGRLEFASFINSADAAASGLPIVFYDSHAADVAGPHSTSGHKVLGVLSPSNTASGVGQGGDIRRYSMVYTSGLCVTQISGQVGFMCTYLPVVSG